MVAMRMIGPDGKLTDAIGDRVQLVGDDLFVTNVDFSRRELTKEWQIQYW